MHSLVLCALLCCLVCVQGDSTWLTGRVSANLQSLYAFNESSGFVAHDYANSATTLGNLALDPLTASFANDTVGVNFLKGGFVTNPATGAEPVASINNDAALLNAFNQNQQFTWELWIQPASLTQIGMIASIGPIGAFPGSAQCPGLYIQQASSFLSARMSQTTNNCGQFQSNTFDPSHQIVLNFLSAAPMQFVVTYNTGVVTVVATQANITSSKVYLASDTVFNSSATFAPSSLFFAPQYAANAQAPTQVQVWQGKILLSAMYNAALSTSDIAQNYNTWLPNSPPIPATTTIAAIRNTPLTFSLVVNDFDVIYGPPAVVAAQQPIFVIVRFPSNGTLTQKNNTNSFIYTPPVDAYGYAFETFSYKVFDGIAFGPTATVTVNIRNSNPILANRVSAGLQSLYLFDEGTGRVARDSSGSTTSMGDLIIDPLTAAFANDTTGVDISKGGFVPNPATGAEPIASTNDNTALLKAFNQNQQFTWEIWVQLSSISQFGVIASLGPIGDFPIGAGTCPGLYLVQGATSFAAQMSHTGNSCFPYQYTQYNSTHQQVIDLSKRTPLQIVVTYNAAVVTVAITQNGKQTINPFTLADTSFNNTALFTPSRVYFAPQYAATVQAPAQVQVWQGKVFLSAFYNTALNSTDIATNYNAWLPNSAPIPATSTITAIRNTPLVFSLSANDLDVLYGPPAVVASQPLAFIIVRPPPNGTLVQQNNTNSFVYTPPLNAYGYAFETFTYKVFDNITLGPTATVTVNIQYSNPILANRTSVGLQSWYLFNEGTGRVSRDSSGSTTSMGDLTIDPITAAFATDSVGVSFASGSSTTNPATGAEPVASANDDTALLNAINQTQQYTWELWVQPANGVQVAVIASLGPVGVFPAISSTVCAGLYMTQIVRSFQTATSYTITHDSCRAWAYNGFDSGGHQVINFTVSAPMQYVITYNAGAVNVVTTQNGGTALALQGGPGFISFSSPSLVTPSRLYFAPQYTPDANSAETPVWQGKVLMSAIYNTALSIDDIRRNYNAWLPNSPPVALATTLTATQNVALNFTLSVNDFDLLYGPPAVVASQPITFAIVQFPTLGTLVLQSNKQYFLYTPPMDMYGTAIDTFMYKAYDNNTFGPPATVTINVQHISQLPKAINSTQIAVYGQPLLVPLVGTNPDTLCCGDYIVNATVLSLPINGTLCVTLDNITCAVNITSAPFVVPSGNNTFPMLLYLTDIPSASLSGRLSFFNTSISYNVGDAQGGIGLYPGTITLSVRNFVQVASTTFSVSEGVALPLSLPAADATHGNLSCYLASLPTQGGTLTLPNSAHTLLQIGSPVPNCSLVYQSPLGKFGPALENFTFYATSSSLGGFRSNNATLVFNVNYLAYTPVVYLKANTSTFPVREGLLTPMPVVLFSPDPIANVFSCTIDATPGSPGTVSITNATLCAEMTIQVGNCQASPLLRFTATRGAMTDILNSLSIQFYAANFGNGIIVISVDNNDPYGHDSTGSMTVFVHVTAADASSSGVSTSTATALFGLNNTELWIVWIIGGVLLLGCCCTTCWLAFGRFCCPCIHCCCCRKLRTESDGHGTYKTVL